MYSSIVLTILGNCYRALFAGVNGWRLVLPLSRMIYLQHNTGKPRSAMVRGWHGGSFMRMLANIIVFVGVPAAILGGG